MRTLAAALLLAGWGRAWAENPGTTAAPILQLPLGSRAVGMGGAFTAVASDASGLYYNPAGIARLNAHEVAVSPMTGLDDQKMLHVAYGGPMPFSGISGSGYASAGASLLYSQNGTIEVNRTNPDGSLAVQGQSLSAGSDLVLSAGYAERVGSTPIETRGGSYGLNHFLGVSGKLIRSTLVEQFSATAVTADAGYLLNSPETGLSFGLSGLNIGGSLKYQSEPDPLPTSGRAGLAWQGGVPAQHSVILATDAEYLLQEKSLRVNAGMEYFWVRSYGVRLGYQFLRENLGMTAGVGFRWRSRFLFDFAWMMGGDLGNPVRLTASYRFGGVAPSLRGRQRRPFIETVPEREQLRGIEERVPEAEPPPRPRPRQRATPPEERGVPGWIY